MTSADDRLSLMPHEEYSEALSAYALDALDAPGERAALEAHLSTCAACRGELAALRLATAAVGLGVEPEAPPASLRARVIERAIGQPQASTGVRARLPGRTRSSGLAWFAAAAAVAVAVGSSFYAVSLRRELDAVRQLAVVASTRADTLRIELLELRRQSAELVQVLNVIGAPDVRKASLSGQGAAAGALGHAYWSPSEGLVFRALKLPALGAGRSYQLWIVPQGGGPPRSMGLLNVLADGSSSRTTPLTDLPAAAAVAVTIEPAGGSATPTLPIVMVGTLEG